MFTACRRAPASAVLIRLLSGIAAASAAAWAVPALASGTPAGTTITNVATATYETPGGTESEVTSNSVVLTVDELLNVTVVSADPGDVAVTPGATGRLLKFTITNSGNGSEAFSLSTDDQVGGDDFNPSVTSIVLDSNGNGVYDAGVDTVYAAGTNDPVLAADASLTVFVLSSIPGDAQDGQRGSIDLAATAKTGSGDPGTIFADAGTGGGDAVVGATRATAVARGTHILSSAAITLTKSANVVDSSGGSSQVPGAVITYILVATVSGSGSLADLRVTDTVPTGSTYEANSIKLNGAELTDVSDADAGSFASGAIAVSLGTVAAGSTNTITFQVKIN